MYVLKKCQLGEWMNKWIHLIQYNQPKGKRGKEEKNPHKSEDDSDGQKRDEHQFHQLGVDLMPKKNCHHSTTGDTCLEIQNTWKILNES